MSILIWNVNKQSESSINRGGYDERDKKKILLKTVSELPEKEKTLLSLYYFNGLSCEEISSLTGVNENTLKKLISTALDKLKKKLDKKGR